MMACDEVQGWSRQEHYSRIKAKDPRKHNNDNHLRFSRTHEKEIMCRSRQASSGYEWVGKIALMSIAKPKKAMTRDIAYQLPPKISI